MRIIAGTARGTRLSAPEGVDTRPTRDQVRESLFNILMGELEETSVLDLFAGSGALALEALSRGAERAVLVDQSREATQCIRRNVEKLRFGERVTLLECDWLQAVRRMAQSGERFDLVFLDPPYAMTGLSDICRELEDNGLLNREAMLVLEHSAGWSPELPAGFTLVKERSYRDTAIHFFRFQGR